MKWDLIWKGAAMGIAEAIPGVSGGTLAFITGIYEELLRTIRSITISNLRLILTDRKAFWAAINGPFLLFLFAGMALGLIFGVLVISHLLEHHQNVLWSFFFGLVLASAVYLAKDVRWSRTNMVAALLGIALALAVTSLTPASGSDHPLYLFVAGCIAISALMLPGLSGSFLLLILGLYDQIITAVKSLITEQDLDQLIPLTIFGSGVLVGLFSFARVLTFLFKKYPSTTIATMIGILIGSLSKLWPWKMIHSAYNKETKVIDQINAVSLPEGIEYKVLSESPVWPWIYGKTADPEYILIILALLIGSALVLAMHFFATERK